MKVLTDEQRAKIVELYLTGGYTIRNLAEQYHVSTSTIWKILPKDDYKQKRFAGKILIPAREKESMRTQFDREKEVKNLINAVSEFAMIDNWTDLYLMQILLSCGLTRTDFENTGYIDFYNDCF